MADDFSARERQIASSGSVVNLNNTDKWEHWKYPETVGNDTGVDDVNFNSHEASEYAKLRMGATSTMTQEPFVMFEFLRVSEDIGKANNSNIYSDTINAAKNIASFDTLSTAYEAASAFIKAHTGLETTSGPAGASADVTVQDEATKMKLSEKANVQLAAAKDFVLTYTVPAKRDYTGSIAMYMPTDIQINDTMLYNEDSRKFAAGLREFMEHGETAFANKAVLSSKAVIAAGAGMLSTVIPKVSGPLGALVGYGLGDIVANEMQRATGGMLNPNEFIQYTNTGLRTFTFNWTILPDSENESKQAAGLIKFFRKSAHAKKNNPVTLTVPDHCVVSFHGAKDMIQLPPCVIESVGVSYNPNTSSFFKQNNSPVEIALTVGLKEMVPIYNDDVEAGY